MKKLIVISCVVFALNGCAKTPEEREAKIKQIAEEYAHVSDKSLCLMKADNIYGSSFSDIDLRKEVERRKIDCYQYEAYIERLDKAEARRNAQRKRLMSYGRTTRPRKTVHCHQLGSSISCN